MAMSDIFSTKLLYLETNKMRKCVLLVISLQSDTKYHCVQDDVDESRSIHQEDKPSANSQLWGNRGEIVRRPELNWPPPGFMSITPSSELSPANSSIIFRAPLPKEQGCTKVSLCYSAVTHERLVVQTWLNLPPHLAAPLGTTHEKFQGRGQDIWIPFQICLCYEVTFLYTTYSPGSHRPIDICRQQYLFPVAGVQLAASWALPAASPPC